MFWLCLCNQKWLLQGLHGDPVLKTLYFQCREWCGSASCSGVKILNVVLPTKQKNKKKKQQQKQQTGKKERENGNFLFDHSPHSAVPHCALSQEERVACFCWFCTEAQSQLRAWESDMVLGSSCEVQRVQRVGERDELRLRGPRLQLGNWAEQVRVLADTESTGRRSKASRQPDVSQ